MDFLFNFSALIQLVAAINFAYILCKFNQQFDSVINNACSNIQKRFQSITDKINLDSVSLQSKAADSQNAGFNCSAFIDKLSTSLNNIEQYKIEKEGVIRNIIKKFVNKEGYCGLFLFLSLYSILDLGLIAWISVTDNWNISFMLYVANVLSLIYALFLFIYSSVAKKQLSNGTSVVAFMCIILFSVLLTWLNAVFPTPARMPTRIEIVLSIISVVLPFLALGFVSGLLMVVNVWAIFYSIIIYYRTWKQRKQIQKEMKKIDTALEVINPDGVSFQ